LSIGTGSRNPEGAAAFISLLMDISADEGTEWRNSFNAEQLEMIDRDKENVSVVFDEGVIKDRFWDFMNVVSSEDPISASVERFKPVFQAQVDRANTQIDMSLVRPFAGFDVIDFDNNGDISLFKWYDPEKTDGMSFEITEASNEAISGRSLKLSVDSSITGEWADVIYTDPASLEIPGFQDYRIAFDYRLLQALSADNDSYYAVAIKGPDGSFGYQRFTSNGDPVGEVLHFEAIISVTSLEAADIGIFFGAHNGTGSVIIDNIVIERFDS